MTSFLRIIPLMVSLAALPFSASALDFDKALSKASSLPKQAPVDAGSSSGLLNESANMQQRFIDQDDNDLATAGAGGHGFVIVDAEGSCFAGCAAKNLSISGPGTFSPSYNGSRSGAIHKGPSGALGGKYTYSVMIGDRLCSGSFTLSGDKHNLSLHIQPSCSGTSNEF